MVNESGVYETVKTTQGSEFSQKLRAFGRAKKLHYLGVKAAIAKVTLAVPLHLVSIRISKFNFILTDRNVGSLT